MLSILVFIILINEINYHSSDTLDSFDWIELYNKGTETVRMARWRFKDAEDDHQFVFPDQAILEPGKYLVLCQDTLAFHMIHGKWMKPVGDFVFGLKNSGESLRLYDPTGVLVDSVRYGDDPPWPREADGLGLTLELANPNWDNTNPLNWRGSLVRGGTPGYQNSTLANVVNSAVLPIGCKLEQNYPNPFNAATTIAYTLEQSGPVFLAVYNSLGQQMAVLADGYQDKGRHMQQWHAGSAPAGLYFLLLRTREQCLQQKMILLP